MNKGQTQGINTECVPLSSKALNRLFDTFSMNNICILHMSMPELIESLICNAHSHILISLTQIALSSNGTTSLNDFGTSPPTHYIHLHVNTLQVLSNGDAPAGVNGILWIYHLCSWHCNVIETCNTVNPGSNERHRVVLLNVVNPLPHLERHVWQNKESDFVNGIKLPLCWHFIYYKSALLWASSGS